MADDRTPCFTDICPPLKDTSSGRPHPCPADPGGAVAPCPYAAYCEKESRRGGPLGDENSLASVLASSYQGPVHVTLAEPSGSFVTRSEHHSHGNEMIRMSLRRHLYEVVGGAADPAPDPYRCPPLREDTRLGQYLGYVDLRLDYSSAALALGVLSVPRKLRIDPDAQVITGTYGPLFGGPAFSGNVYSRHDSKTAGAACAQACMIMVLGMLADRGAVVEGSYTLTQLGFRQPRRVNGADTPAPPEGLRRWAERPEVGRYFPANWGLDPSQIVGALRELGVSAEKAVLGAGRAPAGRRQVFERLAQRIIECYVQARYPVILGVDPVALYGPAAAPPDGRAEECGHALTVVGLRKYSVHDREPHFVIHDPAQQPFMERPASFIFEACWKYATPPAGPALVLILPAEREVSRSLIACLRVLWRRFPLFATFLGRNRHYPRVSFDCQFSLLYHKDIHTFLWPLPLRSRERESLDRQLALPGGRYWCVAGYADRRLRCAWFFSSDGGPDDDPLLFLYATPTHPRASFSVRRPGQDGGTELALPDVLNDANL